MKEIKIAHGTVHKVPKDIQKVVAATLRIHTILEDITPLARNEWICWIESAKKEETRSRRIEIMIDKFMKGERRPCCWAGCPHREKNS